MPSAMHSNGIESPTALTDECQIRSLTVFKRVKDIVRIVTGQVRRRLTHSEFGIKNFGQMDERFYRGAQPWKCDYKDLARLGVRTVIDLRDDPKCSERTGVEASGMRYVNIPMSDTEYPNSMQVDAFLDLINEQKCGKFFVHCAGGRHRTGVIGAVYRFNLSSWTYDRVYSEMKSYDFYARWGHGALKRFVQDYWRQLQMKRPSVGGSESTPIAK